jgi:hypothetical protein
MFRRRGLIRPFRRRLAPDIPPLLQRANALLAKGNYSAAAEAFEKLAHAALSRRGPRAPMFFLQAGRARILNGQTSLGVENFKQCLSIFASQAQWPRLQHVGQRTVMELNERGFSAEAKELEEFLKSRLPAGYVPPPQPPAPARKPVLPTHCPACGAGLRPDEVEWLDEVTAECAYCGSPVRGESQTH